MRALEARPDSESGILGPSPPHTHLCHSPAGLQHRGSAIVSLVVRAEAQNTCVGVCPGEKVGMLACFSSSWRPHANGNQGSQLLSLGLDSSGGAGGSGA